METAKKELTYGEIDAWWDKTDIAMLDEDCTEEVNGLRVSCSSHTGCHTDKVDLNIYFVDYGVSIESTGYKEVSYDRWITTDFYSWDYS